MIPIQTLPQGATVRVRRGRFPLDARTEGREGLVLHLHRDGFRYGVRLHGEMHTRIFTAEELEPVE